MGWFKVVLLWLTHWLLGVVLHWLQPIDSLALRLCTEFSVIRCGGIALPFVCTRWGACCRKLVLLCLREGVHGEGLIATSVSFGLTHTYTLWWKHFFFFASFFLPCFLPLSFLVVLGSKLACCGGRAHALLGATAPVPGNYFLTVLARIGFGRGKSPNRSICFDLWWPRPWNSKLRGQ